MRNGAKCRGDTLSVPEPFDIALARFDAAAKKLNLLYALIGGIAVVLQGYSRVTRDVDITVWDLDSKLDAFLRALVEEGFSLRLAKGVEFARNNRILLLQSSEGVDFDVSLGALPFEREMIERADHRQLNPELSIPIARPEDLIAMKIFAGRPRDLDDARQLANIHSNLDKPRIRAAVREFSSILDRPDMMSSLESVIGPD